MSGALRLSFRTLFGVAFLLSVSFFVSTCTFCYADVYMHNPPGSNNRLNEASNNRNNANRLFDSQNNNRGGYNVGENCPNGYVVNPVTGAPTGPPVCTQDEGNLANDAHKGELKYFEGSWVYVEWTSQHGCGRNNNTFCQLVLQYMCWPSGATYRGANTGLVDGTVTNGNPPDTGVHEPIPYYTRCQTRNRNAGLYIADQRLPNNGRAINTRQNPNGNRRGSECPEERDYYPYWHPSPWKDIAVMVDEPGRCDYYRANSQNKKSVGECECTGAGNNPTCPSDQQRTSCWSQNNQASCTQTSGCQWREKDHSSFWDTSYPGMASSNQPEVDCVEAQYTRDNHLGDTPEGRNAYYWWKVPSPQVACGAAPGGNCGQCAIRLRYNISTSDYDKLEPWQVPAAVRQNFTYPIDYFFVDRKLNGARTIQIDGVTPPNFFQNNPIFDAQVRGGLALAHNTAQTGRVFQDRSHRFHILSRQPVSVSPSACIFNINRRGKRGNIVQVYPGVEYDFTPSPFKIMTNDFVVWQWTGSNRNPRGNDGQGRAGTDRSNLVQMDNLVTNTPRPFLDSNSGNLFSRDEAVRYSTVAKCTTSTGCSINNELDDASAYFYGGLKQFTSAGVYYYMCTRNNNFSNRSQKASLEIISAARGSSCEPVYPPRSATIPVGTPFHNR